MTSELTFRIIQALIIIVFIAHRGYYTRKYPSLEEETLEKQESSLSTRAANLLSAAALLALLVYLVNPRWLAWSAWPAADWMRWLGVIVALVGFALLQWSHAALGRNWSDQPRITATQKLVDHGPYRWIRHPIYTAFILILGSTILITANWLVGGLWILVTLADIRSRIRFEETRMLNRFGDEYQAYRQRTGSLFPRL
ncbi:MAG: isoprenylcysteine carboxylmethyltransferase family protein [Chloroflexota bacterium]|nr:MAG: isoprenylcysteine carboxylmethyltransferase family protein [Chloroflexota bacterium]